MAKDGVYFAGEGDQDLMGNAGKMSAAPSQPSGSGDSKFKFADGGGGDSVSTAFGTDKRFGLDESSHDINGGKGFTPINDNSW